MAARPGAHVSRRLTRRLTAPGITHVETGPFSRALACLQLPETRRGTARPPTLPEGLTRPDGAPFPAAKTAGAASMSG